MRRVQIAVALILGISPARADPPKASLVVLRDDGSHDCPDAAAIASRVRSISGANLTETAQQSASDTWVQVEIARTLEGYRASIAARGRREGTRALVDVGPGCANLGEAIAVTLAILLDPDAPAAPKPQARPRAAPPPKRKPDPVRFGLEVVGGAAFAVLEHPSPLLEAGARVQPSSTFSFGAGGAFVFPDSAPFGGGQVELGLSYGYVRACAMALPPQKRATFELCVQPMFGALRGRGQGYEDEKTMTLLWSAFGLGLQMFAPLAGPFYWTARGFGLMAPVRPGFSIRRDGVENEAFRVPALGALLAIGAYAEF